MKDGRESHYLKNNVINNIAAEKADAFARYALSRCKDSLFCNTILQPTVKWKGSLEDGFHLLVSFCGFANTLLLG